VTPHLELVIDELVLDGVEPGDPVVDASIADALSPALAAHGLAGSLGSVTAAVATAVGREAAQ
jgi:hypothetical protein